MIDDENVSARVPSELLAMTTSTRPGGQARSSTIFEAGFGRHY